MMDQYPKELAEFATLLFSKELRQDETLATPEARRRRAEAISGYKIPNPPLDGEEPSPEYTMMVAAIGDALRSQSNIDYAIMQTREVSIYDMMATMMFPPDADSLKNVETRGKCDTAIDAMHMRLKKQYDELALGDERLKRAIADGNKIRRDSVTPDKR